MRPVRLAWRLIRELGPIALLHQASYRLKLRSGWLKARTPIRFWREGKIDPLLTLATIGQFRVEGGGPWAVTRQTVGASAPLEQAADQILEGIFPLFGRQVELGYLPDWQAFAPLAESDGGARVEADHHWSEYDLTGLPADVKLLWEPSRFGWAFTLARAYRETGRDSYANAFGELFESWIGANALNAGPHWISGQEVALRGLALVYARCALDASLVEMPETNLALMEVIAGSAARVSYSMNYARAQNNNHLLSEGALLYTVGALFPRLSKATIWRRLGRRALIDGYASQVWPDGGYTQHSLNYHRLAFELGLLVLQVAHDRADRSIEPIQAPLRAMLGYLEAVTDEQTGLAPNLGPNDGAVLLPRAGESFADMRPTIQAGSALLTGEPRYRAGTWDGLANGLGIVVDTDRPAPGLRSTRRSFPHAGLEIVQQGEARGLLRCARFRSRPGHADQLHFDLWLRGHPILIDAGSYLYNGQPPWDNPLRSAFVHNTLTVAGKDQMTDVGRFLYLDWAQGELIGRWEAGQLSAVAGLHSGYLSRGFLHQRTVATIGGDFWLVVDDLVGSGSLEAEIAWLMPDSTWQLEGNMLEAQSMEGTVRLQVAGPQARARLVRGGKPTAGAADQRSTPTYYGWQAGTYAHKEPALHLRASLKGEAPLRTVTTIELGGQVRRSELEVVYRAAQRGQAAIAAIRSGSEELVLG